MNVNDLILKSDYILSIGTFLSFNNEDLKSTIVQTIKKNEASFIYLNPIDNFDLKKYYSKLTKYEVGSEEGIVALLLYTFVRSSNERIQTYIEDLDIGYISAESSAGEEEFEEMYEMSLSKKNKIIILGEDIFTHARIDNIIKICSLIQKYSDFNIVCLNTQFQNLLNEYINTKLQDIKDVNELNSYNGTLVYPIKHSENILVGSNSFANLAKIKHGDEVLVEFDNQTLKKSFIINDNLQGTIALCSILNNDDNNIFKGYCYKQVKIKKVVL